MATSPTMPSGSRLIKHSTRGRERLILRLSSPSAWPFKFSSLLFTNYTLYRVLSHVYHEDTAKYGKPEDTEYTTVDLSSLAAWQVTLGRHAAKVQASKKRTFE